MPSCNTTVTTPTGIFTYYKDEVTYCEAKERCAEKGEVLAPLTNYEDVDALRGVADFQNPNCPFHHGAYDYYIGLDISRFVYIFFVIFFLSFVLYVNVYSKLAV